MKKSIQTLTTQEVAQLLHIHPKTVRVWVKAGILPEISMGHRTKRYLVSDINNLLQCS